MKKLKFNEKQMLIFCHFTSLKSIETFEGKTVAVVVIQ